MMFISRNREKELQAILFFVKNTNRCNTLKLFKLLNFLDFEHYRQTGRDVTGLTYKAFKQGPVPDDLWREIHQPKADLSAVVTIAALHDDLTDEVTRRDFTPKSDFDPRLFTKRELKIMETLAFFFRDLTATQMSLYSHSKNMPWKKVYRESGPAVPIPYSLALESDAILKDMPSIDRAELEYREDALKETRSETH